MSAPATILRMTETLKSHGEAHDLFLGELARQTRSSETRRQYRWILGHLADDAESIGKRYVNELVEDDYERTLNRWTGLSASTLSQRVSCFRTFSRFVYRKGWSACWVCQDFERPRRPRAEDLDVVSVGPGDVLAMFGAVRDAQEFLCLATPAFLGARRRALSRLRRGDVDLVAGTVRFHEKGQKVIVKPLPYQYQEILLALDEDGLWAGPEAYLIPSRRPAAVRRVERSDKVIWETVKRVAERAGVSCHVHALRAAFAVAFDEAHPGELYALKELMGHSRIETTLVYLRRKDREKSMQLNRDLTWGLPERPMADNPGHRTGTRDRNPDGRSESLSVLSSDALKAHTGFEPVFPSEAVAEPLLRKLAQVRALPVVRDPRSRA